ncbi:MraY-like glycosyltransferase [Stieleria maiorica]|uniref:histidine kinase n=1 Tax=Stieleria maiorica TaxID=2795974 RepID=A0A5B9M7B2_9BACT|nr:ATP-binding protein [Stieleria maiorica]QEF96609.1 MraY-like glycosyltransferase [Stieleria maiorica]
MVTDSARAIESADTLFRKRYKKECLRVSGFIQWLMVCQWLMGIAFAAFYSPLTWIGNQFEPHVHLWASVFIGGSLSAFTILWLRTYPTAAHTRHVVATTQMLWSALLIHLSGGRIETHFHVFASLAILSIYRDWTILITATAVIAVDHFVRGVFYPLSAFGIVTESPYRWIEHALWVLFEVAFLAPGCRRLRNEFRELCARQTEIVEAKRSVDIKVDERTKDLVKANLLLAIKTAEAEKLALVAKYTDNAVAITDGDANVEWVNEGFTRITGFEADEIIGAPESGFQFGELTCPQTLADMRRAIDAKQAFNAEMVSYRKDGTPYWMAIELRPIPGNYGTTERFISIQSDITDRVEAERQNRLLQQEIVDASRQAGMAEVATGVLHNVGNILNSVNVSASVIRKQFENSALKNLEKATDLISQYESSLAEFIEHDDRGKNLPKYLVLVAQSLRNERVSVDREIGDLTKNIEHIKEIIAVQQTMAKTSGLQQELHASEIIRDVMTANKESLTNHAIEFIEQVASPEPTLVSDKHRILQILINLVCNAKDALLEANVPQPRILLRTWTQQDHVLFEVTDNGIGIRSEDINKIFQHGFTTKAHGHGFGLHSSANAATEIGGRLSATSAGIGKGARFVLRLPVDARDTVDKHDHHTDSVDDMDLSPLDSGENA